MLPRFPILPMAVAILAGCSATNNYDSNQNPFDEPISLGEKAQPPPSIKTPPRKLSTSPVASKSALVQPADDGAAIAIAVPPDRKIEVSQQQSTELPHAQEMIDEANRLGSIGDVDGKAELLRQTGYAGSPKAFYDLARMYLDGSLPKDMPEAVKFITLAHDAGYDEASRVLGMLYLRGQGVPADEHYGRLLLESASKTSIRAGREYGQLLVNQSKPELNDPELGMRYLRDAAERGDKDAALSLAKALTKWGQTSEAQEYTKAASSMGTSEVSNAAPSESLKDRALRGDAAAIFNYGQQVMLRKIPDSDPEFTAYCWISVAGALGNPEAVKELGFIRGVRTMSDKKNPGRLDQCISDLHYQISG